MEKINKIRKVIFYFWIILVFTILTLYFVFPNYFTLLYFQNYVDEFYFELLIIYFLILSLRGLTLIPSTPLLFAGIAVFNPIDVLIVNMLGVITSSTIVYYFASFLGFDEFVERKYQKKVTLIKSKLEHKELPIIIAWGFFPAVPTDVIVYASSTLRIKLWKVLTGVFIGELILNSIYVLSIPKFFK